MSDLPTSPDGHDPIAELSARTATITVHEENGNGGYASLPPPGSREWSPANTVIPQDPRHGGRTPVQGEQEVNYGYQDQHQYMDYPLGMPMARSTFSPVNTDWNGQTDGPPYPYILPPPPPMPLGRIVPSPTIQRMPISMNPSEHTHGAFRGSKERFLRPGEPFAPLTPVSDARNTREGREGQEDGRSSGVYQPPHIIRMQQQRHPQERPYAPHRQELPYTPQSDMQRSFQRRGPLKEQRNEAGEWRAGPRNNVTGGMVFKNATPHNGGERKRHVSNYEDELIDDRHGGTRSQLMCLIRRGRNTLLLAVHICQNQRSLMDLCHLGHRWSRTGSIHLPLSVNSVRDSTTLDLHQWDILE